MNTRSFGALRPKSAARPVIRLVLATVTALTLALGLSATAAPATALQAKSATASSRALAAETYESRVQRLVNLRRASHGLPRLRLAACADGTAESWSRYLAASDQFFHQSMTSVLNACNARYAGETLGRGSMTPRKLVRMWMHSPGHRAVLLSSKSRRIGIGATPDRFGRWVVAATFIRF
jgi:uncharacterized protein YkwD